MAGDSQAEFVAGDLAEDFGCIVARSGRRAARRWYARQVLRSAPALLAMRIRSGELTETVLRAVVGVLLPLAALDQLWRFVYSQIPLKDGVERAPALLAANVLAVALCSWAMGTSPRDRTRGVDALAAMAAALVAVWVSVGESPALYVASLLAVAPAHSLWTIGRRKLR
jgi:hypothetical protein